MAKCLKPIIKGWQFPGEIVTGFLLLFIGVITWHLWGSIFSNSSLNALLTTYTKRVIYFSFYQAFLSTILSIIPALFIAKALSRRSFPFKNTLLNLCSVTLILPSLVVVFGLITLYGRSGLFTQWLSTISLGRINFNLYGLNGILLAHIFFNLPFATTIILKTLDNLPVHQIKLSAQLNLTLFQHFRIIEYPILKRQVAHLTTLIFTLCFSSFSIVLLLGGGPKATTIELAIYQSITYDYDFAKAMLLSLIQIIICIGLLLASQSLSLSHYSPSNQAKWHMTYPSILLRFVDYLLIIALVFLILPPLFAIIWSGFSSSLLHELQSYTVLKAMLNSILIGFMAAFLSLLIASAVSWTARQYQLHFSLFSAKRLISLASLTLVIPSIVLTSLIFIIISHYQLNETIIASPYFLVSFINSLMALPFVLNLIYPAMLQSAKAYEKIASFHNIFGINRFWQIDVKANFTHFKKAFAFAFTLSLGDVGIMAILGNQSSNTFLTLPYLLFLKLGTYQSQSAEAIALLLFFLVFIMFKYFNK